MTSQIDIIATLEHRIDELTTMEFANSVHIKVLQEKIALLSEKVSLLMKHMEDL